MNRKETILSVITHIIGRNGVVLKTMDELEAFLQEIGLKEYYDKYMERYINNITLKHGYEYNSNKDNVLLTLDFILSELYRNNKQDEIIMVFLEIKKLLDMSYVKKYLYNDFENFLHLYRDFGLEIGGKEESVNIATAAQNNEKISDKSQDNDFDMYETYNNAISYYVNGHLDTCIKLCRKVVARVFFCNNDIDSFEKWLRDAFTKDNPINPDETEENKDDFKEYFIELFINDNKKKFTQSKINHMIYLLISDCCKNENAATKKKLIIDDALFMLRVTQNIIQWMY